MAGAPGGDTAEDQTAAGDRDWLRARDRRDRRPAGDDIELLSGGDRADAPGLPSGTATELAPDDVTDRATASPVAGRSDAGLSTLLLVVAVAVGVGLRLWILMSPLGRMDSDEVMLALMARHIGSQGVPVFFWGQHYGGTAELVPLWLSLKVFGDTAIGLRLPALLLGAVNSVLVWRLGRRLVSERQAQLAGLLLWLGPAFGVWWGVHEYVFYTPTVTFGLLLGLFAYRVITRDRWVDYAALGCFVGLSWWTSSNSVYFLAPAALIVLVRRDWRAQWPIRVRGLAIAGLGAIVGAAPWIYDCIVNDGAPLHAGGGFEPRGTYPEHLVYYFTHALPGVLGLRDLFTFEWLGGPFGVLAYVTVLGVIGLGLYRGARRFGWDALGFVIFPFAYAFLPMVTDDTTRNPNQRYLYFLLPMLALLIARVVSSRRSATVAVALTVALTGVTLHQMQVAAEVGPPYTTGVVGDTAAAIRILDAEHIDAVYGDYWVAYLLTFQTSERIIATPSSGTVRYDPYRDHVRDSPRSAWVVTRGAQTDAVLIEIAQEGVTAEVHPAGDLVVVIPARPVPPEVMGIEANETPRRAPVTQ